MGGGGGAPVADGQLGGQTGAQADRPGLAGAAREVGGPRPPLRRGQGLPGVRPAHRGQQPAVQVGEDGHILMTTFIGVIV